MFEYSPELQEKITVAAYSIIITGFVTFAIGYYLGKKNSKYQELLRAAREFRDAFSPALVELDPIEDCKEYYTNETFSHNIVTKHFEKQRLAVQIFSNYLSARKKKKLDEAWKEYAFPHHTQFPGGFDKIPNIDYVTVNPADEPKIRDMLRKRISNLVSFGKY